METALIIFIASFVVQLLFLAGIFSRLSLYRRCTAEILSRTPLPLSVVICARNEKKNISENLPLILKQQYENFEVVVVDDGSTDGTGEIINRFMQKYPRLKYLNLPDNERPYTGKKIPLSAGIRAASHETIVVTDADCKPASPQWLACMASGFTTGKEIALGYGPVGKRWSGSHSFSLNLLNQFARYETFITALHYFSFLLSGMPYMGVGRNMAYKKGLFLKKNGYKEHLHIPSGDDDLFVNRVAHADNTAAVLDPRSFMHSAAPPGWRSFFRQKRRHAGTSLHYKFIHQLMLGISAASHIAFFACALFLLQKGAGLALVIPLFMTRGILQLAVYRRCMKRLACGDLWTYTSFLDFLIFIYYCILPLYYLSDRKPGWK